MTFGPISFPWSIAFDGAVHRLDSGQLQRTNTREGADNSAQWLRQGDPILGIEPSSKKIVAVPVPIVGTC